MCGQLQEAGAFEGRAPLPGSPMSVEKSSRSRQNLGVPVETASVSAAGPPAIGVPETALGERSIVKALPDSVKAASDNNTTGI